MNKALSIALTALGGFAFFGISFLAFARLSGVPLHQVAVVGPILIPLLGIEPPEEGSGEPQAPLAKDFGTAQEVVRASVGALGAFALPAPFQREEMMQLSDELKATRLEAEQRAEVLRAKEKELADQLARLEHMSVDMARMRDEFEAREVALELRAQEVQRDEAAKAESDQGRYKKLAGLLLGLEAKEAATRLQTNTPEEGAKILAAMDPARAGQILAALPKEAWNSFSQAYAAISK